MSQSQETLNRDRFGAGGGLDTGGDKARCWIAAKRFQALPQHLAPLAECGCGHSLKRFGVAGNRLDPGNKFDQG